MEKEYKITILVMLGLIGLLALFNYVIISFGETKYEEIDLKKINYDTETFDKYFTACLSNSYYTVDEAHTAVLKALYLREKSLKK